MPPDFNALTIKDIRPETRGAVSILFDVPAELGAEYRFEPGQYLTLRATLEGEEVRRSYSVCAGLDDAELRIAVKRHEDGLFSSFANERLKAGDRIEVMKPKGRFTLPAADAPGRSYLMLAAGSGITPVLSIVKTVLAREADARVVLIYGNRDARSIMFKAALEDLKDRYLGRFTLLHVLSREHQEVELLNGRIDAAKITTVARAMPGGKPDLAYLCGPTALLKEGREALEALGLPRERIKVEIFTAQGGPRPASARSTRSTSSTPPTEAPVATARVKLHGREKIVPMAKGESVLEAAIRAGIEAPFSCKGGMCCTCRARLTDGKVEMAANYSLEPWELEAGFVLTCQSHPRTTEVAVDYDAR
jgi:ring-1,2-phenylacetyl-CoA epoxidase subunit PaaE